MTPKPARVRRCPVCGRSVPVNGFAWASHMRAHVRRGEAREVKDPAKGGIMFQAVPMGMA